MLYLEYDWTFSVYRFRVGTSFTDFRGTRSLGSLGAWRELLAPHGLKIGRKTGSRTWEIVNTVEG